jgi:4-amino-4-deoxy-L-arabinose transferase-like glycosyltransferase
MIRGFIQRRISFGTPKLYRTPTNARSRIAPESESPRDDGRWSASARQVAVLVGVGVAARVVLAVVLGLGVDESYEVVMSRVVSLGYFDHPPLSFWIPALVARVTGSEHRVLLRLPFILLFAGTTIALYRLTARFYGERAGVLAALLLNITPVFSLSTGGWILPDGPLALAFVATTLCLAHVLLAHSRRPWHWWIAAGVAAGVALLSKYHAVFLFVGAMTFIVTSTDARYWLKRPHPYVAVVIAFAFAIPVIVWNARHDSASIRFQAGRATTHGIHFGALAQNIAGQLGYLTPWIGVPLLWQLVRGLRIGPREAPRWLLCCLAVGPIIVFTSISLGGNPGLPHWPAPGYLLLFPLLGDAIARYESRENRQRRIARRAIIAAASLFLALVVIAASDVVTGWAARVAPSLFVRGDPSLEAVDWADLRPELARRGLIAGAGQVVAATNWIEAAKIGYALGPAVPVLCFCDDPRGFQFAYPPKDFVGRDAILLVRMKPEERLSRVIPGLSGYFRSIDPVDTVGIRRAGRVEMEIGVYRGRQ